MRMTSWGGFTAPKTDRQHEIVSFDRARASRLVQGWVESASPVDAPMRVVVVRSAIGCKSYCPEWISAEGQIVGSTPGEFKRVIKAMGKKRLPIIVHSGGGEVDAAVAIGRMIRAAELEVAVGKTLFDGCAPGQKNCGPPYGIYRGMAYSRNAVCASACPLLVSGGKERLVGAFGIAAVHAPKTTYVRTITTYEVKYNIINGKKVVASKKVLNKKTTKSEQRKLAKGQIASLSKYLLEMGVDTSLIDIMEETPYEDIHRLSRSDLQDLHLITKIAEIEMLIDREAVFGTRNPQRTA